MFLNFVALGFACAVVVRLFAPQFLKRVELVHSLVIANVALYVSLAVSSVAHGDPSVAGQSNLFTSIFLIPFGGIATSLPLIQPMLALGILLGAAACDIWVTKESGVPHDNSSVDHASLKWSMQTLGYFVSILVVLIGFPVASQRTFAPRGYALPDDIELELPNLKPLGITGYSSKGRVRFDPGKKTYVTEGKCSLSKAALVNIQEKFDWRVATDEEARNDVRAANGALVSPAFDLTFRLNPLYREGHAYLHVDEQVLYFTASYSIEKR